MKRRLAAAVTASAVILVGSADSGAFPGARAAHAPRSTSTSTSCGGGGGGTGPVVTQATQVQQITGPLSARWGIDGADLGVAWSDGVSVFHVFGDNYSSAVPGFGGPTGTDWQPNALGWDTTGDLCTEFQYTGFADGTDTPSGNRQAILPAISSSEDGIVPSGGIHVNGKDYLKYIIFPLGHTGQEQTRANGIAESDDGGITWHRVDTAVWMNDSSYTEKFQQQALAEGPDGHVYVYSTPSERHGDVYLMQVPDAAILDKEAYRYWTGTGWSSTESSAEAVFAGPAGEMSALYLPSVNRWVAMYNDDNDTSNGSTVLRYSTCPTGPWSSPQTVLPDSVRTIYAPMIDPRSTGTDLYFYGSDWNTYQTYLFHSTINLP